MPTLIVPEGFQYVTASVVATSWLLAGQSVLVGRYRKNAGIPYPYAYAEKVEAANSPAANRFNCAQRAHQNTLESLPVVLVGTVITGLAHPILAASLCGSWVLSRIFYTRGYITGEPKNRYGGLGALGSLASIAVILSSTYVAGLQILANL
ncbi:hypothetical protein HGRIS_008162 [Hohenbuehelia grisea]|uniref:Microsomal glutathione S-transferase 3 n=1 Tax=Hohenbuehelia grisea TaxID=104357 RepID=A0ABR3J770_9AGAR